jgi:hypothetical protein
LSDGTTGDIETIKPPPPLPPAYSRDNEEYVNDDEDDEEEGDFDKVSVAIVEELASLLRDDDKGE